MGQDVATDLSKTAGLAGNERNLKDFLTQIKDAGATDVLLVPTSKDIDQLHKAEKIISTF